MSPDTVTTYASTNPIKVNASLIQEFNLLLGRHFNLTTLSDMWWL